MTTAVILAAGRGTRLRPLTDRVPKALMPVGNKPLVEHLVADIIAAGVTRIIFIVGHLSEMIERHFELRSTKGAHFSFIKQTQLNGTGGALQLARHLVTDEFIVVFGDSFYAGNSVRQILASQWENAIGVVRVEDPRRFGVVEISSEHRIIGVTEKPELPRSNLIIAGMYKLQREAWKYIMAVQPSARGELEMPDAINAMIGDGIVLGAVEIEHMIDVGTPDELERVRRFVSGLLPGSN